MGGVMGTVFNYGARICAAVMCCITMGLDRDRSPRSQRNVAYILLLVLVVGALVSGVVHLSMSYRHEMVLGGGGQVGGWGADRMSAMLTVLRQFHVGTPFAPPPSARWPHFIGGIIVAMGLQAGCMAFPKWPIHPIALLFVGSRIGDGIWPSIFIGWLIKTLITTYGGARGYRAARPLFLGLVLGEVFAVILWTAVPVVLVLLGADPATLGRTSILID